MSLLDIAVSVELKRNRDKQMIESWKMGGPPLMEAAGLQLAQVIAERFSSSSFVVICGTGNNGGDGYVLARWLHLWGHTVQCVEWVCEEGKRSPESRWAREVAKASGVALQAATKYERSDVENVVVVDAILGSGTTRAVPPDSLPGELVTRINDWHRLGAKIVAIDSPTGMLFGQAAAEVPLVVHADLTLVVGVAAPEHHCMPWRSCCGELQVITLGFERWLQQSEGWQVLHEERPFLLPPLLKKHKASVHRVLVVGGREGMAGAARLVARGAFRAGAGLVYHLADGQKPSHDGSPMDELITPPCGTPGEAYDWLARQPWHKDVVLAVGPGLGRDASAELWMDFVTEVMDSSASIRMILDADGLVVAGTAWIKKYAGRVLCTPHPGEAAMLLGWSVAKIQSHRLEAVRELVRRTGAHVVLKGEDPMVLAAGSNTGAICHFEARALATAGSGDVLTGVCAALLARKGPDQLSPEDALLLATWWHQRVGAALTRQHASGWLASEIADKLPDAV